MQLGSASRFCGEPDGSGQSLPAIATRHDPQSAPASQLSEIAWSLQITPYQLAHALPPDIQLKFMAQPVPLVAS